MSLQKLTDDQLRNATRQLADHTRQEVIEMAEHLIEIEGRRLHLVWGYSSLWDFCERDLRLSDGVAQLRIDLARLLREKPEIKGLILTKQLGICSAGLLWRYVKDPDFEQLLVKAMELSKRELKELLDMRRGAPAPTKDIIRRIAPAEASAEPMAKAFALAPAVPPPSPSPFSPVVEPKAPPTKTHRISYLATEEDAENLRRLMDLMGTRDISAVMRAGLEKLMEAKCPRRRVARRKARDEAKARKIAASQAKGELAKGESQPPRAQAAKRENPNPRRPPRVLADEVLTSGDGCCEYKAPDGTRCTARARIQIDHFPAYAKGGQSRDHRHLRRMCDAHNLLRAREDFGAMVPAKIPVRPRVPNEATSGIYLDQSR